MATRNEINEAVKRFQAELTRAEADPQVQALFRKAVEDAQREAEQITPITTVRNRALEGEQIGWQIAGEETDLVCNACAVENYTAPDEAPGGLLINSEGFRFYPIILGQALAGDMASDGGCGICGAWDVVALGSALQALLERVRQEYGADQSSEDLVDAMRNGYAAIGRSAE